MMNHKVSAWIRQKVHHGWRDFSGIIFPRYCAACGNSLLSKEKIICLKCLHEIPRTRFDQMPDNPMAQLFWGRCRIENAAAWFTFMEGSRYQKMLHLMKYKGRKDIAKHLGIYFGAELSQTLFAGADLIIPVPLHPGKLRQRGYNQSEYIAQGISVYLKKPVNTSSLLRKVANPTQTNKSGFDRWENVEGIFTVSEPEKLKEKHILLVDDVVTTGATMDACANALLQIPGVRVSLVSLAIV